MTNQLEDIVLKLRLALNYIFAMQNENLLFG